MIQEQVQAWKWLKQQVAKVPDPTLRNAMMVEFRQRALRDWGYCPEDGSIAKKDDIVLNDWERGFLADIKAVVEFGVDPRKEKREKERREARGAMKLFIENGGTLADIPDDICTPEIRELFYETLFAYGDELIEAYDDVANR